MPPDRDTARVTSAADELISEAESVVKRRATGFIYTLKPTFGFIKRTDRTSVDNYFFIPSCLPLMGEFRFDELEEGWSVTFRPQVSDRGPFAGQVEVTGTTPPPDFVTSAEREKRRANKGTRPTRKPEPEPESERGQRERRRHRMGGRPRRR